MQLPMFVRVILDWFKGRSTHLVGDAAGATSIEYSVIATLISIAIIGGVTYFGSQLNNEWLYISNIVNPQLNH